MCKIRDAGKVKARDRIAVLAALNLAFDVSDRGAFQPAAILPAEAPAQARAKHDGNGEANGQSNGHEASDPRLASLLTRLDTALGDDGRLI
jgi:cell division protein ZapA